MRYIDVDAFSNTFSSSSADLDLPDCSVITFAGLYWSGSVSSSNIRYSSRNKAKLSLPGSGFYIDLTADESMGEQYFKDITKIVQSSMCLKGTFTIADIVADKGKDNVYAGWTIVIVYQQNRMPVKNLSVFDGWENIQQNGKKNFTINGFSTPTSGAFDLDFGFVAYDGDRGDPGDCLRLNDQLVSDKVHNSNDFFNSSISYSGSIIQGRNPFNANTLGLDASSIHLKNDNYEFLSNGMNSASINLETKADVYSVGVITLSIEIAPNFQISSHFRNLTRSASSVRTDESIEVEYGITNNGTNKSSNTVFVDTIPLAFDLIKESVEIQYDGNWHSITEKPGDDQGEYNDGDRALILRLGDGANAVSGGTVGLNNSLKVRYKIKLVHDSDSILCSTGNINKYSWLNYFSGLNYSSTSNTEPCKLTTQEKTGTVLTIPIGDSYPPGDLNLTFYCPISVADLALPKGYSLYKEDNTTAGRGVIPTPVATVSESGTYKAYRKLAAGCEFSYNIRVNMASIGIAAQPAPRKIVEGKSAEFSVETSGPDVKYQWQEDSGYDSWTDIPGATNRVLTLRNVSLSKNRSRYRALVSNPCGQKLVSYEVLLNVVESKEGALFVPNAFKPNSAVEELTHFMVKGHKLSRWQMRVYNKWDQLIWETNRLNPDGSPAEGWDGKIGGQDAPQDIYLWAITAVFCDGSEWKGMSFNQSEPRKTGLVYLIR